MRKLVFIITVFAVFAASRSYAAVSQPKNVSITYDTVTGMQIAWDASSDTFTVAYYNVYRNTSSQVDETHHDLTDTAATTGYHDSAADATTPYYYGIQAVSLSEKSAVTAGLNTNPRPPQGITASRAAYGVALTWIASADLSVTGYKIYRSTDGIYYSFYKSVSSNLYTDLTVTTSDLYYKITSNSNNTYPEGAYSPPSGAPGAVRNAFVSYDYNNSLMMVAWKPSTSIYPVLYNVYRSQAGQANVTNTVSNTFFMDPGADTSSAYFYDIQAVQGPNTGAPLAQPAGTNPRPPTGSKATSLNSKVLLTWDAALSPSPVTEYNVYRSSDAWADFISFTAMTNETLDTNQIANGINYEYRITSLDLTGAYVEGASTLTQTAIPFASPYQPAGFTAIADPLGNSVNLSWSSNAAQGTYALAGYDLYRSAVQGALGTSLYTAKTYTAYTDTAVTGGTQYYYQLFTVDTLGNTSFPSAVSVYLPNPSLPPSAPSGMTAASVSSVQVNLQWVMNNIAGQITGFNVYRSSPVAPVPTLITSVSPVPGNTTATATDTNVTLGSTYTYGVTAFVGQAPSVAESVSSNAITVTVLPAAPVITTISPTGVGALTLNWSAGPGESGTSESFFNIYRAVVPAFATDQTTLITQTAYVDSYVDTTVVNTGTRYFYKLSGVNMSTGSGIEGPASDTFSALSVTVPVSPLDIVSIGGTPYNGYVYLSWTAAPEYGATSYTVYRSQNPGIPTNPANFVNVGTTITSSTTPSMYVNVTSNVVTAFAVTSNNPIGASILNTSTSYFLLTPYNAAPEKPMNLTATSIGGGAIDLSWSPVNGPLVYYNIYRSLDPAAFTNTTFTAVSALVSQYSDQIMSLTDTASISNTSAYYYKVAGVTATAGTLGAFSDTVSASAFMSPAAPANLTLNNIYNGVLLSWQEPAQDYTYDSPPLFFNIYRSINSAFGSPITKTTAMLYSDFGMDIGNTSIASYNYKVTAVDSKGNEDFTSKPGSVAMSYQQQPPAELFARPGNRSVTLIWTKAVTGTYNIYRSTEAGDFFTPIVYDYPFPNKQYVDKDPSLDNLQNYFYAVSVVTDSGEGTKSVTVSAAPYAAPVLTYANVSYTVQNFKDIRLQWTAASPAPSGGYNVAGYNVYRSNDGGATYGRLSYVTGTAAPAVQTYTDMATQWNNTYYYRITVVDANSNEDTAYNDVAVTLPLPQNKFRIYNNLVDLSKGQQMTWQYYIVKSSKIKVTLYTLSGVFVKTLLVTEKNDPSITTNSPFQSEQYKWDGTNAMHKKVASGVYILIMELDNSKVTDKIAVVK